MSVVDSPFAKVLSTLPDYRLRVEFWAIFGCVVLFVMLFELVRRNRLKERYSLLWFLTALVLLTLALKRDWLEQLAALAGIYYAPTALFLVLIFFLIVILVHFSTVISKLLGDTQTLTQKIALLEAKIEKNVVLNRGERTSSTED